MSTTSLFLRKSPSRPHQTAPFVLMSHDNFPILSPSGVKEMEKPCQLALHAVQVMEQATLKRWEVSNHWKNILSNKKKKKQPPAYISYHLAVLISRHESPNYGLFTTLPQSVYRGCTRLFCWSHFALLHWSPVRPRWKQQTRIQIFADYNRLV